MSYAVRTNWIDDIGLTDKSLLEYCDNIVKYVEQNGISDEICDGMLSMPNGYFIHLLQQLVGLPGDDIRKFFRTRTDLWERLRAEWDWLNEYDEKRGRHANES